MSKDIKKNNLSEKNKYRPEIDGLRAFAVLAVIINHFNKEILPNGYLGVDIFFVISGFVITSSLYQRPSKNFKDFISGFYERRIKRLVPALSIFVLIMSIAICLFNPNPSLSLKTGITSLFGLSNIFLFQRSTDYFAQATELNVFTHTWSLGVEEQFYILFPLLIWLSGFGRQTKNGARNLFLVVGAMTIASLIGFLYLYSTNQPAAYFLMPSRFWEMSAGCLIFIGFQKRASFEKFLGKVPPLLVLALMVGVMYLPIFLATASTVAIVILSTVLLASLKKGTKLFTIFTHPKVVYIGLISYSLYLWHWGVLSISRWTIGIHWWSVPFQVVLMLGLAVTSYRYIESPLRKGNWFEKRWKTLVSGGGVLVILSGCLFTLGKPLKGVIYVGEESEREELPFAGASITRKNCMLHSDFETALEACWINKNKNTTIPRMFFIGDSHNESMSQAAEYISENISRSIFFHSRSATLFPVSSKYWLKGDGPKWRQNSAIQSIAENYLMKDIKGGDVVVITLRLPYYFGPNGFSSSEKDFIYKDNNNNDITRREFFENWKNATVKLASTLQEKGAALILSSPSPEWNVHNVGACRNPQWFQTLNDKKCNIERATLEKEYRTILEFLETLETGYKNVYIFDTLSALCPDGTCHYIFEGKELYLDANHLSNYAMRRIIGPHLLHLMHKVIKSRNQEHYH